MLTAMLKKVMNQIHAVPSLRQLALVRVAAEICHHDEIKTLLGKCEQFRKTGDPAKYKKLDEWKIVQSKAAEEVSKLCMVEQIKPEILELASSMMLEILDWILFHSVNPYLGIRIPKQFYWTGLGNLDKKRTAEWILRNETLAAITMYKIASTYCLEEEIRTSWEQMPSDDKERFYVDKPETTEITELGFFWCHIMQHEFGTCNCCNIWTCEGVFHSSVFGGNVTATKFFLQKFSLQEKKVKLRKIVIEDDTASKYIDHSYVFPEADYQDVGFLIFSQMEEKDRMEVSENHPFLVLNCFLYQHRQVFFMETARQLWCFLTERDFALLLQEILYLYLEGRSSFHYNRLFVDFWRESPQSFKSFISTFSHWGGNFLDLLIRYDFPYVAKRRTHVRRAKYFCKFLKKESPKPPLQFDENKWRFLKVLLQEHIATRDSLTMYREHAMHCSSYKLYKEEWDQHLDLVDRILAD